MQTPTSSLAREYVLHTKDNSAANIAVGKERMAYYYTFLLEQSDNYVIERTKYSKLKANQRSFLLPSDYIKMKRVRVKIANVWYRVDPEINLDKWADDTMLDITSSIPTRYNIINEQGQLHIELTDIPNLDATSNNFEIMYEGYQDPLYFPDDITIGLVSLTQGSSRASGSEETTWTSDLAGRFLKVTNGKTFYEIGSVGAQRSISLVNYFQEADIANTTYVIAELPRLPHAYHKTPLWGAVQEYYLPNNEEKAKTYGQIYTRDLLLLQSKFKNKTKGFVTPGIQVRSTANSLPRNYPTSSLRRLG